MKKRIFNVGVFVAVALVAGYNVYSSQKSDDMSDMALANVEALASGEGSSGTCRWSRVYDSYGCVYHNCVSNGSGNVCSCGATEG